MTLTSYPMFKKEGNLLYQRGINENNEIDWILIEEAQTEEIEEVQLSFDF